MRRKPGSLRSGALILFGLCILVLIAWTFWHINVGIALIALIALIGVGGIASGRGRIRST